MNDSSPIFALRSLPLVARLVLAAFLLSVGVGYFSALVQLHFQAASPGQLLPGLKESGEIYHGKPVMSQLQRLLVSDETKPFNGSGSMRSAFTTHSAGWKNAIKKTAKQHQLNPTKKADLLEGEKLLRAERDGEIQALVAWIQGGLDQKAYDDDGFVLPAPLASHPITEKYVDQEPGGKKVHIKSILDDRCVRCHSADKSGPASQAPLEEFEQVQTYAEVPTASTGMSLRKLAQTTHVHLLGFAMLYGLTGLIFCFTRYPLWLRFFLAPLPLVCQVMEICLGWWGGRVYEPLALAIPVFGAIVAVGLFFQIVGTLFDLFGRVGKAVVLVLLVGAAVGIGALKVYVMNPYLQHETVGTVLEQPE